MRSRMFPRSRWKWAKRIAAAVAVSTLAFALEQAIDWKLTHRAGQRRHDAIAARLDATDPGWRFEDMAAAHDAQVPPDEANGPLRAVRIVRAFPKTGPDEVSKLRGKVDDERDINEPPPAADWAALEAKFPKHEAGLAELRAWTAASPRGAFRTEFVGKGRSPLDVKMEETNAVRVAVSYMAWDAQRTAFAGRPDDALATAAAALHLVRSVGFAPHAVCDFVRVGAGTLALNSVQQTLAWCPDAGDAALAALQDLVRKDEADRDLRPALRGERAVTYRLIELVDRGEIGPEMGGGNRLLWFGFRQHMPGNLATALAAYDDWLAILDRPEHERVAAIRAWTPPEKAPGTMMVAPLMGAGPKLVETDLRYRAKCRATVAALACERYRRKNGRWPDTLADFGEFGIEKGPTDPFDGQPLRFLKLPDGAVVYSVGPDGQDDGGTVVVRSGAAPDVGFRLWNPDRRNAAADAAKN